LTAFTVIVKDCVPDVLALGATLEPLSVRTTLKLAVPDVFAAAV
jgi:hypothetical protein